MGVVGGCAGESCCEVDEAQFLNGVLDAIFVAVGGLVRSSSVGAAFRAPMRMVGARREGGRSARLRASKNSLVSSPNGTFVSSTVSSHLGPTHSYATRQPSGPGSGWECILADVSW